MTNLEKYLNNWARRVDNLSADYIQLLLDELTSRTQETMGVTKCSECMTVDELAKYAGDIVKAVTYLRQIQVEAKKVIITDD